MYVYRVATKSELGPYQGGVCDARHYDDEHPAPDQDGIPENVRWEYTHNYGFKSKEQLLGWFSKSDLRRFEQQDFYVWRYSVPKSAVHIGGKQLAFDLNKVTERKRVDRKEFASLTVPNPQSEVTPSQYRVRITPPSPEAKVLNNYFRWIMKEFGYRWK